MFSLSGKTALVTGASGGIGKAVCLALKAQGAKLVVSGSNAEKLNAFASELGGDVKPVVCNLNDLNSIDGFMAQAEEAFGGVDILVCNAGITKDGLAMRMKDEDWQAVIDINLTATFRMNRAAIKTMMKRRYGRIVNITSVVGHAGNPGQANYCAAKAGIAGMSRSLAQEVASRGITVNCIAPGFIATPMTDVLTPEQNERILKNIPAGRMGTPEEIAACVAFLASQEAGYVTGSTIHANGGMYMV